MIHQRQRRPRGSLFHQRRKLQPARPVSVHLNHRAEWKAMPYAASYCSEIGGRDLPDPVPSKSRHSSAGTVVEAVGGEIPTRGSPVGTVGAAQPLTYTFLRRGTAKVARGEKGPVNQPSS